jgi:streptogramin lyase
MHRLKPTLSALTSGPAANGIKAESAILGLDQAARFDAQVLTRTSGSTTMFGSIPCSRNTFIAASRKPKIRRSTARPTSANSAVTRSERLVQRHLTLIILPNDGARARRLANNPDGLIYYSDFARGFIGRLDPKSAKVEAWPSPGGPDSHPYRIASTRDGVVWYSESGVNQIRY